MLLAHTSGIRDNWGVMDYYPGDPDIALSDYLQQYLVAGVTYSNLNYTNNQPGTSFSYSNNGAALVGLLVEAISGVPFNQYCNQNIFEPLSMESRWFLNELDVNNIAMPYNLDNGSGDNCFDIGCGVLTVQTHTNAIRLVLTMVIAVLITKKLVVRMEPVVEMQHITQ